MPAGLGAAGCVGVAFEVTPGTYVAPTKFIPIRSESLKVMKEINFTRPIIKTAVEPVHAVNAPEHVEGDIEWEIIDDCMVYFLHAARMTVVKAGTTPNFTYTYTPSSAAQAPNKTLSITVERNGEIFGYTGCVLGGMSVTVDNGLLVGTMRIMGLNEASQAAPAASFPTTVPYGADAYTIEIPAASPITDAGSFTFELDDSPEAQFRLGSLAAQYVKFGERNVSAEVERDFIDRTQYDLFRALTAQSVHLRAEKPTDSNRYLDFLLHSGVMDSYETFLEGQGELITASLSFIGKYDFTQTESYQLEVGTSEDIT